MILESEVVSAGPRETGPPPAAARRRAGLARTDAGA